MACRPLGRPTPTLPCIPRKDGQPHPLSQPLGFRDTPTITASSRSLSMRIPLSFKMKWGFFVVVFFFFFPLQYRKSGKHGQLRSKDSLTPKMHLHLVAFPSSLYFFRSFRHKCKNSLNMWEKIRHITVYVVALCSTDWTLLLSYIFYTSVNECGADSRWPEPIGLQPLTFSAVDEARMRVRSPWRLQATPGRSEDRPGTRRGRRLRAATV